MDRNLWKIENYRDFLAARRELLAKASNDFLDSLLAGSVPQVQVSSQTTVPPAVISQQPVEDVLSEEERTLRYCNDLVISYGLPGGEYNFELADSSTGERLAIIDLAWPDGIQQQYSSPVAVLTAVGNVREEFALWGSGMRHKFRPADLDNVPTRSVAKTNLAAPVLCM